MTYVGSDEISLLQLLISVWKSNGKVHRSIIIIIISVHELETVVYTYIHVTNILE